MSDIPKGATHKSGFNNAYYKKIGLEWFCATQGGQDWKMSNCATSAVRRLHLTPIKQDKEMIYTEQSYNVGETPIRGCFVGLLVGDSKDEIYGRIVASTRNYIILLTDDDFEFSYNKLEIQFRPYNTRTDTEKAIDDLADGISASYSDD